VEKDTQIQKTIHPIPIKRHQIHGLNHYLNTATLLTARKSPRFLAELGTPVLIANIEDRLLSTAKVFFSTLLQSAKKKKKKKKKSGPC